MEIILSTKLSVILDEGAEIDKIFIQISSLIFFKYSKSKES